MHSVSKTRLALVTAALLLAFLPLSLVYGDDPPAPPKKADPAATPAASAPAAPVKAEQEVKGDKPAAPEAPVPPPPSVRVGLSAQGLTVNGEKIPKEQFNDAVKKAAYEKGGKVVVSIDSDGGVTMGKIHGMQSDLRELGLNKVVYTGELGEAVPLVLPPDTARKKLQTLPEEQKLKVKVDPAGVVTVGGKKIAGADLPKLVHQKMAKEPHLVVVLHTENDTKYGAFLQTLQYLRKGGADKIAIQDPGK